MFQVGVVFRKVFRVNLHRLITFISFCLLEILLRFLLSIFLLVGGLLSLIWH